MPWITVFRAIARVLRRRPLVRRTLPECGVCRTSVLFFLALAEAAAVRASISRVKRDSLSAPQATSSKGLSRPKRESLSLPSGNGAGHSSISASVSCEAVVGRPRGTQAKRRTSGDAGINELASATAAYAVRALVLLPRLKTSQDSHRIRF